MLTYAELVELERSLRGERVLSVYVDGSAPDPAAKHAWRRVLDDAVRGIGRGLAGAPHDEREAFRRAASLLEAELAATSGALGAPGWAAFITAEGVRTAGPLPTHIPSLVRWERGARVAPYVRALEQQRPVVVAVVDTREARLYRYREGALEALDTLRAHAAVGPFDHMGDVPREHFHTGTRGSTGTDAAERELRVGTERMLAELAGRLTVLGGDDAWIVLGGTPQAAKAALATLPGAAAARATVLPSLGVWASEAEIRRLAAEGATVLREAREGAMLADLLERKGARGNGAVGASAVLHALDAGAVQELLLSTQFLERHAADAELAVRAALGQRSSVEVAGGAAAERLDREAGGIVARLRFVPPQLPAPPHRDVSATRA